VTEVQVMIGGAESSDCVNGLSGNIMFYTCGASKKGRMSRNELWSGWL